PGSTSLLWTLILSVNYWLLPSIDPVLFTVSINAACILAIGLLLRRMAVQDGLSSWLALLVAVAPMFDGNYVWLAFTGMEHLLFRALSLAWIWLWLRPSPEAPFSSTASVAVAGLCMGLLGMARPEGVVLPVLLLGYSLLRGQSRNHTVPQVISGAGLFVLLAC